MPKSKIDSLLMGRPGRPPCTITNDCTIILDACWRDGAGRDDRLPSRSPMTPDDSDRAVLLWPAGDVPGLAGAGAEAVAVNASGERSIKAVHFPSIVPFLPAAENVVAPAAGLPAVLVIPGGGHSALAYDSEGTFVARWLAARGVAGFVLKYRLGRPEGISPYALHRPATAPDVDGHCVLDTERAVRLIRSQAAEWGVDPTRVGAMGFSAGGECASWACMRPGLPNAAGESQLQDCSLCFACKPLFDS